MSPRARRQLAGAWAMVPFALLLVSTRLGDPPAQLPTHWTGTRPDGLTDGGLMLVTALTVAGFSSILAALVALVRVFVPGEWSRWIVTLLSTVSGGVAAAYGVGAAATSLAGDPGEVHIGWATAAVMLGLAAGFVAYRVHGLEVPPRQELLDDIPERSRVVPLTTVGAGDPGGQGVEPRWTGRSESRLLVGLSIYSGVIFAVCVALLLFGGAPYRILLVAVVVIGVPLTLFVVAWSRIRIVVDGRGLRVRSERLPVTLMSLPPDRVLGAEVLDVDPMQWGGYGLRATLRATAYLVEGGDALVVHRANGRRLALECTEGEPREGAALLLQVAGQALAASRSGSAEV